MEILEMYQRDEFKKQLWFTIYTERIICWNVLSRPSFSPWTCELCSQEMNALTGNITKYFKIINKFDLFCSFCTWKVLLTLEFQQIGTFWYIFSCLRGQTSTKFHKKSGWHCRGSQEGKKKKTPCQRDKEKSFWGWDIHFSLKSTL